MSAARRVIIGTLPANIVPALVSVAGISLTTRLLAPQQLGSYTLVFSAVMAAQTMLFTAPALAVTRFRAAAHAQGGDARLLASAYAICAGLAAVVLASAAVLVTAFPFYRMQVAIAAILLLLRSLVAMNQAANRARGSIARYTAIECTHAICGLGVGLGFVELGFRTGNALLCGLAAAAASCVVLDAKATLSAVLSRPSASWTRQVIAFAWPLACAYAVTCALQYSDRMLVGTLAGPAFLGIYGVAFSLVDRPVTLICTSVTTGTFPLAVEAYVRDGPQAGRIQAGQNGAILIGLALPAAIGLAFAAPCIAAILVGPAFRSGVASLIPILAAAAFLRGVSTHFVDHAFHLAKASRSMLGVYAPWAIASVVLSALTVTRYGMQAAAWSSVICQAGALVTGWWRARTVLPLWLPARDMAKIGLCTACLAMTLLLAARLPIDASGLGLRISLGGASYTGAALLLDLAGLRRLLQARFARLA